MPHEIRHEALVTPAQGWLNETGQCNSPFLWFRHPKGGCRCGRYSPYTQYRLEKGNRNKIANSKRKTLGKRAKNMKQLLFTCEQKLFQLSENKKGPLANGVIHLSEGRSCIYNGLCTVLLLMRVRLSLKIVYTFFNEALVLQREKPVCVYYSPYCSFMEARKECPSIGCAPVSISSRASLTSVAACVSAIIFS